ncbi:MAG: hypothetical protein QXF01_01750 [Candidatus Micrarchaeaceae archaeon]
MDILGFLNKEGRNVRRYGSDDEKKPVKWIPDGYNSWRIVYADKAVDEKS